MRNVGLLSAYAFDRVRRIEFQGGFSSYSFESEERTKAWEIRDIGGQAFLTNNQLLDTTISAQSLPTLNLATGSAAMVFDNSLFGATSPILGQRYRLEVSPMLGSLTVFNVLADYRRYFMPLRPFTFAVRMVHNGRYGPDGDSPRLYPMYLGYQTLIRGYPQGSFIPQLECPINEQRCPAFDRLLGSRIAVANAELRFPLLGALGVGSGYYGGLPLELAFFADAGVAWTGTDGLWFMDNGPRKPVYSVGAALRLNLLGFAVIEVDFTRPLSRPEAGWVWQFGFVPGF
jgi:outer membrane protein assembly factor BamA